MPLVLFDVTKSPLFIKCLMYAARSNVVDGLRPVRIIRNNVIEHGWVPFSIRSHHNIIEFFEFPVSRRSKFEVGQAFLDIQWDSVVIVGSDVLQAANFHGSIIDVIFKMLDLTTRMDGLTRADDSALMKDAYNGTSVGLDNTGGGTDW